MRTLHTSPEPETRALTRADRCDRCSARALVRALLPAGELLFCGHHARAHEQRLVEIGATLASLPTGKAGVPVLDGTPSLEAQTSSFDL